MSSSFLTECANGSAPVTYLHSAGKQLLLFTRATHSTVLCPVRCGVFDCELQKPIPNHQSSFCWICLPLLTQSIIRSSCPPSHHWTSLGFHFTGLNPISLVGLSRWPGEGRYPKHINWSLGFPRDRFLDPSSSPHTLHHWVPSYRHMASPTISRLMTHSSISHFRPDDPKVAARISGCLADNSAWMK